MEIIKSKFVNNYYIDNAYNKEHKWNGCDKFVWTADNGDWHTVPHAQVFFATKEKLAKFKYDPKYNEVAWNAPLVRVKYEFKVSKQECEEQQKSKKEITMIKMYNMWLMHIINTCKAKSKVYIINTGKHSQDFPVEYITKQAKNYQDLETCCEDVHSINFDMTNEEIIKDIAMLFGFLTIDDKRDLAFAGCVFKKSSGMMLILRFKKNPQEDTFEEFTVKYFKSERLQNFGNWTSLAPGSV